MTDANPDLEQAIANVIEFVGLDVTSSANAAWLGRVASTAVLELLYERGEIERPRCPQVCDHGGACVEDAGHGGDHRTLFCSWPQGVTLA